MGTGGPVQQGIQAATAAVQGLAGSNLAQALTAVAAPYPAEIIHQQTITNGPDGKEVVNVEANLIALRGGGRGDGIRGGQPRAGRCIRGGDGRVHCAADVSGS